MAKKKMMTLLSLLVLPTTCNVISCGKTSIERESLNNNNNNNKETKKISDNLKNDEEIKKINAQISKIKNILSEGIDGSKDFTPSQSLADITVQKKIIEKVKALCNNPENINFISQLKSQYFKAGNENYVDVEVIYTKEDFQISSMHHNLQIKNVKQDLKEVVDKALEDLKDPIDFSKSFLIQHDDFNYDIIENEFINVLNNQLEQEDERLSIKLINRNQALLNNRKITIEVIGKDDNEEIRKIIQVTSIKLLTVNDYIDALVKFIPITRTDKLFANSRYNPYYWKEKVSNVLKDKFTQLNIDQLRRREIESFTDSLINPNITFTKGSNRFPISIQLKYNKLFTNIDLILLHIENHPEFILNEVANHFVNNGLDLSNEPIFTDSKFDSEDVKNKVIEIMKTNKSTIDENDDIEISINHFASYSNTEKYYITFSHKDPRIIERWTNFHSISWQTVPLKNIQTSPEKDLDDYLENHLTVENTITIEPYYFDLLDDTNLKEYKELIEHINVKVRNGISFTNLPSIGRQKMQLAPIEIVSRTFNNIKVKYEFEFEKSGVTASRTKDITFRK